MDFSCPMFEVHGLKVRHTLRQDSEPSIYLHDMVLVKGGGFGIHCYTCTRRTKNNGWRWCWLYRRNLPWSGARIQISRLRIFQIPLLIPFPVPYNDPVSHTLAVAQIMEIRGCFTLPSTEYGKRSTDLPYVNACRDQYIRTCT
jgi:hypothetical protein